MLTLGNQKGLGNDLLASGIVESIVSTNQMYKMLPFAGIHGNALAYNREGAADQTTLVGALATNHSSINKTEQKFTRHSTELTSIIGDAQVNGLIQAVGSDVHDATAVQVAAKAKGLGRTYMNLMIHGNEAAGFANGASLDLAANLATIEAAVGATQFATINTLTKRQLSSGSKVSVSVDGVIFTTPFSSGSAGSEVTVTAGTAFLNAAHKKVHGFKGFDGIEAMSPTVIADAGDELENLDAIIDGVKDKDGMVDYLMMNSSGTRVFMKAMRSAGGATMMETRDGNGAPMSVMSYRGVPIFRNDYVGSTSGADTSSTIVYAGTLDDGSFTHGLSGLTASKSAGIQVQKIGAREDVDAEITRVKWYAGLANFSTLGLVKGGITA